MRAGNAFVHRNPLALNVMCPCFSRLDPAMSLLAMRISLPQIADSIWPISPVPAD